MSIINTLQILAATLGSSGETINVPDQAANVTLVNIMNGVYYIAGAVAVIVIIIAALRYVTSAGNANSITAAKNQLTYSIVGLVIVILAFAITNWVAGRF